MYTSTTATTELDASSLPIMLNIEQAASLLNVSGKHMRDLARDGAIRAVKVGNAWRIPRDQFLAQYGLA